MVLAIRSQSGSSPAWRGRSRSARSRCCAILDLALKHQLPAMYELEYLVEAGGVISYGINVFEIYRLQAFYIDKILRGAKPGDLPIERATKFELVINAKTAKALGLTIPPSLLARADQVIE
jgi:putative tryptophan/tyrosine transport system substrate-binding protein